MGKFLMAKLLQRLPRNVGLWVPLLVLPLVLGELWLHARGDRPNPGMALSLGALMAMLGWYLLGGSIALSRARAGLAQRRQLARLLPQMEGSGQSEWAVADDGMVLAQSHEALDHWGDYAGRPLAQLMAGQLADAGGETARLIARALRHGRASHDLPDGRQLCAERAGTSLVRLSLPAEIVARARRQCDGL